MFTAIALIAFSGVSMANTIKNGEITEYSIDVKVVKSTCVEFTYHMTCAFEAIEGCFTSQEYNTMYNYWNGYCQANN